MGLATAQYGGNQPVATKRVYYGGTTPLKKGQPVCYVEDANIFVASDPGVGETDDRGLSRGVQVETPTSNSLKFFAGIVSDGDAGKSEAWIDIIQPRRGDVLEIRVEGTTDIAVGDGLEVTNGNTYFTKDAAETFDLTLFRALEAFTANSEGTILAQRL